MKKWKCTLILTIVFVLITFTNLAWSQEISDFRAGGRVMNDWTWMSSDKDLKEHAGNFTDGTEFREIRLFSSGTLNGNIDFKLQFDISDYEIDLKDVYIGFKGLPVYIMVGNFKEPFSLEELTSSKYTTFMERSLPSLFYPKWNSGLQISSSAFNNRLTWAAGVFGDTDNRGYGDIEEGYNITGRVTGLPMYMEDGEKLLHLGLSATNRSAVSVVRYAQRPEAHLAPYLVDTRNFSADNIVIIDGEAAAVYGPFSLQGELFSTSVESSTLKDPSFLSYYAQASFFITGEHRPYKLGVFTGVKPESNFGNGSFGALELAARYSYLDLDDVINDGKLSNITFGINWYLNSHSRIMLNYVRSDLIDVGVANILGMRLQVEF